MEKILKVSDNMKKAQRIMVNLGLSMTGLERRMRRAVRLVHLEGKSVIEAAESVGVGRQRVYTALKVFSPKYELVKDEVAKHGAKP